MTERHDHQGLHVHLERLERTAHDQLGLLAAFADLREFLEKHFEHEESPDGLFAKVRRGAPLHEEMANVLEREHTALLRSAEFIAGRATVLDPEELQAEVEEFISLIRAHEIAEGILYQDAFAT